MAKARAQTDEERLLEFHKEEMEKIAMRGIIALSFQEWAETTPGAAPLAAEWLRQCEKYGKDPAVALTARYADDGSLIYTVSCANAYHESREGHLAALRVMLDAHRED